MTLLSVDQSSELGAVSRATETEVLLAAGTFGTALRRGPEFERLRAAGAALGVDDAAQEAIEAFNRCQSDLQLEMRLGKVDARQQAEFDGFQAAVFAFPTVAEYVAAQSAFEAICRETATLVSSEIGIDFAANCRSGGCCGG
jgi:cell fate (sporulation/competence/biofilm development) regulator YlbF (YheA/YmcA/DUF963 family)